MARLIHIHCSAYIPSWDGERLSWNLSSLRPGGTRLPQLVWDDGSPFREANLWAYIRGATPGISRETVESNLSKLLSYARFVEENQLDIWHFPEQRNQQVLLRYRGSLIEARNCGVLSPSGASHRMRVAIQFYRFLGEHGLIDPTVKLWKDRRATFSTFDSKGFERTISVNSTDLAIRNRSRHGLTLEDGLLPLSGEATKELVLIARDAMPREFYLMVLLGLSCGLRIGTITDLKVETFAKAERDPLSASNWLIHVGPAAYPAVATKFNVSGQISVPERVCEMILKYANSSARLTRASHAEESKKGLLFITRSGGRYADPGSDASSAIRVLCHTLRQRAKVRGSSELATFRFHQTRATFATRKAIALLAKYPPHEVVLFLKRALLHSDEASTFRYIRFVEQAALKAELADAFTNEFLGATS